MESMQLKAATAATPFDEHDTECSDILKTLDDDCFNHVFEYLSIADICTVMQCCRYLHKISEVALLHKFRTTQICVTDPQCIMFKKYSGEIQDLVLKWSENWFTMANLHGILSPNLNLKKLGLLNCFPIVLYDLSDFSNILSSLSELRIKQYWRSKIDGELVKSTMEHCHQLEKLIIDGDVSLEIFQVHYPKLRELSISNNRLEISDSILVNFFLKHPDLTKLKFHVGLIARQELDMSNLTILKKLTDLNIEVDVQTILYPNFKEMTALKYISFNNCNVFKRYNVLWNINNNCKVRCNLRAFYKWHLYEIVDQKHITSLEIDYRNNEKLPHIIQFVKQSPKLRKVYLKKNLACLIQYSNIIIIYPELIKKLISENDAEELKNYIDMHFEKPPSFFFTHFNEICEVNEITFVELSSLSRYELMEQYPNMHTTYYINQAKFSQTKKKHLISRNSRRQRIFFANVEEELTIFRFKF